MQGDAPAQLVELRSYRLVPGAADAFAEHFERRFLASQEGLGMDIVGQFTVPGDDARFVWVRRFLRPAARGAALERFYTGPVWEAFGPRANELMVDHTDVHLLTPDRSAPEFAAGHVAHAARTAGDGGDPGDGPGRVPGSGAEPASTVVAAVYDLGDGPRILGLPTLPTGAAAAMADAIAPGPGAGPGACPGPTVVELGRLVTASVPNDFPRLPVHEGVTVGVWLLSDGAGGDAGTAAAEAVATRLGLPVRTTRLAPTARSTLR
ncbi:MAG TPA: NIPSNAP family protein [Acidimicrobiales bacterium]|nr:NIPSNAP family protein [Acidimicrobiales bacterium]